MNADIFSISFRQVLLQVDQHLTLQEKEKFRFYFNRFLPKSAKSLLEMFEVLEDQQVISCQGVEHIKKFLVTIRRNDIAKLLEEYETRVSLKMVIYGYLDFRSGTRNAKSPMVLATDPISQHLVNTVESHHQHHERVIQVVVKPLQGTSRSLKVDFNNVIGKSFPTTARKLTWKEVMDVIQLSAELVYVRCMYLRNFKQLMTDVEEVVEDVLGIKIVPWMVEHGGIVCINSFFTNPIFIVLKNVIVSDHVSIPAAGLE